MTATAHESLRVEFEIAVALRDALHDAASQLNHASNHARSLTAQLMQRQPLARFSGPLITAASQLDDEVGGETLDHLKAKIDELLELMECAVETVPA